MPGCCVTPSWSPAAAWSPCGECSPAVARDESARGDLCEEGDRGPVGTVPGAEDLGRLLHLGARQE